MSLTKFSKALSPGSMRSVRFVSMFTALVFVLGTAQSNPVAHANQASTPPDAQKQLATVAGHASAALAPPVHFARAVTYSSGGFEPVSIAVGDVNGDGKPDLVVANQCQSGASCNGEVSVLLGNGNGTFQTAVSYSSGGIYANSVVIADVNGDGKPDLVVANQCPTQGDCNINNGEVSVLLNNGDGTFQPPIQYDSGGCGAISVAIGDVNGDGKPDLVVANDHASSGDCRYGHPGEVSVLAGNGDGTFQPAVAYGSGGVYAISAAVGDLNGDGKPDLVVENTCQIGGCDNGGAAGVLLGNGDGTFQPATSYNSGGYEASVVAIGDVNGDGHPDLIVANVCAATGLDCVGSVGVLLGNGDGTFHPTVSYNSGATGAWSVAIRDVNGDGRPDLVVANVCLSSKNCGVSEVSVLLGNGDGTFQSGVLNNSGGQVAYALAIADVNADGKPDLLVTNLSGTVGVLLNNFTAATTTAVTSSLNPSQVNQSVTFTVKVTSSSSVPNGSKVTFYDGVTGIGTGTTTNGVATLTTSFAKAGTHTIKAKYSGDTFHKASSGKVYQVVNP